MAKGREAESARSAEAPRESDRATFGDAAEGKDGEPCERPADPEAMSRADLVDEVRRLRAESASRNHLSKVADLDEESTKRRLAHLEAAIAAMPVGFALFDNQDRLILKNNRFMFHDSSGERDRPGTTFEQILRFGLELGMYLEAVRDPERWLADRLRAHAEPREPLIQLTRDGRYIQIQERRLPDGGIVGTYMDVSRAKEAEEALDQARLLAERANRAKSVFLANMSHELRTPLNAIIGFIELLLSDAGKAIGEEKRLEYLGDIDMAAKHLSAIITDILDISRVEAGQYDIAPEPLNVVETCEQIARLFEPQAKSSELTLALATTLDSTARIKVDPRAFRQMLINLLSNALQYSRPGGRIEIGAETAAEGVRVYVQDWGEGIAPTELGEVVKPFYRGREPVDLRSGGLGLGLALTSMLIELHGGALKLDSELGKGTTATLIFPPLSKA